MGNPSVLKCGKREFAAVWNRKKPLFTDFGRTEGVFVWKY